MKVLVIDDDPTILEYVTLAFNVSWPEAKIITAHLGRLGIRLLESGLPDIVILDLELPDMDGFGILQKIRSYSVIPVIIITVKDNEQDVVKGLSLGADDYLAKPFGQLELIARVRNVFRRTSGSSSENSVCYGQIELDPIKGELSYLNEKIYLTRTESIIMQKLIKNHGCTVAYEDLAEALWGSFYPNAVETLRVYIRRLRKKVEKGHKRLIYAKSGVGYLLDTTS